MISVFPRLRLLVLAVLALAIGVAVYAVLDRNAATAPPPIRVLVATRDIQIAEPITSSMVAIREIPAGSLPGPTTALAADLPRVLASSAREPLYQNEVIQKVRLFGPGLALSGASEEALLKKGLILITAAAGRMAMPLSGLKTGDHVIIYGLINNGPPAAAGAGSSLRTSQLVVQPIDAAAEVTFVDADRGALTLAVSKAVAPTLLFLNREGALAFGQVRPDDPTGPMASMSASRFRYHYALPPPTH